MKKKTGCIKICCPGEWRYLSYNVITSIKYTNMYIIGQFNLLLKLTIHKIVTAEVQNTNWQCCMFLNWDNTFGCGVLLQWKSINLLFGIRCLIDSIHRDIDEIFNDYFTSKKRRFYILKFNLSIIFIVIITYIQFNNF